MPQILVTRPIDQALRFAKDHAISACEKGAQWQAALQLFKEMGSARVAQFGVFQFLGIR